MRSGTALLFGLLTDRRYLSDEVTRHVKVRGARPATFPFALLLGSSNRVRVGVRIGRVLA